MCSGRLLAISASSQRRDAHACATCGLRRCCHRASQAHVGSPPKRLPESALPVSDWHASPSKPRSQRVAARRAPATCSRTSCLHQHAPCTGRAVPAYTTTRTSPAFDKHSPHARVHGHKSSSLPPVLNPFQCTVPLGGILQNSRSAPMSHQVGHDVNTSEYRI